MSDQIVQTLISAEGHARLVAERGRLWSEERPRALKEIELAAGNIDRWEKGNDSSGTRKRLQAIDRRIAEIDLRLTVLKVAEEPARDGKVRFGSKVAWRHGNGRERAAIILGIDELNEGAISIAAPIAQAMLGAAAGETVEVETPAGEDTIEILSVSYPS